MDLLRSIREFEIMGSSDPPKVGERGEYRKSQLTGSWGQGILYDKRIIAVGTTRPRLYSRRSF